MQKGVKEISQTEKSLGKIGKVFIATVIILAILISIPAYLNTVNIAILPPFMVPFFSILKTFFALGPALFALGFMRNIFGYIFEYTKSRYKESYDFSKYLQTIAYYVGLVGIIAVAVPAPYNEIGSFVLVIINLAMQAIGNFQKPTSTPPSSLPPS